MKARKKLSLVRLEVKKPKKQAFQHQRPTSNPEHALYTKF